jgi:hypothetical protein
MIRGTNVAEITESLPSGEIIRIFATGDRPRIYSFEIIDTDDNESIELHNLENIEIIANIIERFKKLDNTKTSNKVKVKGYSKYDIS